MAHIVREYKCHIFLYTVEFKSIDQDSEIIALGEKIIMKGLWRKNKSSGKHLHKRICLVSITFSIIYKNINSILKCLQISMLRSFDLALMSWQKTGPGHVRPHLVIHAWPQLKICMSFKQYSVRKETIPIQRNTRTVPLLPWEFLIFTLYFVCI